VDLFVEIAALAATAYAALMLRLMYLYWRITQEINKRTEKPKP
jgi:hypothetical protein